MENWQDKIQVKKGNIGEKIVKSFVEQKGMIVYEPKTNKCHIFDFLLMKNKYNIYILEVKTKPRRKYYNDTGINLISYEEYENICLKHKLKLFLCFVDEYEKKIYGNWLNILSEKILINNIAYPLIQKNIIYFPLDIMKTIKILNDFEINEIKKYTSSNYLYE